MYTPSRTMSPSIGGRASDGGCDAADTIWLSSPRIGPPLVRVGRRRRHIPSAMLVPAIHDAVGSKPTMVTDPLPYARSAATVRSPALARERPSVNSPVKAGRAVAVAG